LRVTLAVSSLGDGGTERVVSALARYWHRAGHRVSVVTLSSCSSDLQELPAGVERVALGMLRPSPHVGAALLHSVQRVRALRRALAQGKPDVVVSFLERTNVLTLLAQIGSGVPVFVCERSDPRQRRGGGPWVVLRRLLYPRASGVVVQTESVAGWARAFCSRVHVIPNFVESPDGVATPGAERGPWRLIAVGRLAPEKGYDLLVDAFSRIAPDHPEWSLTILGDGPERRALEALATERCMQGRILLPGRVPDPLPFLLRAHAFALPSRYEGFPNALLEAMACGLPAVAFDCPSGPADIVRQGHDGVLVRAEDVGGMAEALSRLMGDAGERARLGSNARAVVTRLAPEVVLDRWSALLRAGR
jgi:glycosyltransferase involved in cell wall biosynthesis